MHEICWLVGLLVLWRWQVLLWRLTARHGVLLLLLLLLLLCYKIM